jgi:serine/threonine-protein kinase
MAERQGGRRSTDGSAQIPASTSAELSSTGHSAADAATPHPDSSASWLGKRIGRYRLRAEIGRGSMGRVFRAEDPALKRMVAVKVLSTKATGSTGERRAQRFMQEARAVAGLDHPNIVTVHDVGQHGQRRFIAMELIDGGDLDKLVKGSGPLDVARACLLASEAAEALDHAHAAGVIHRDIKPSNLMLGRSGRCKVADFGLALVEDAAETTKPDTRAAGTPLYMAPEVICGTPALPQSDIYSLGATLFFLLTGGPPYPGPGKKAVLDQHLNSPVPDIRDHRPLIPDGLAEIIGRCLAKDPAARYADAGQLAKHLRVHTIPVDGSASVTVLAPMAPIRQAPAPAAMKIDWRIVAGASALAAVVLVSVVVLLSMTQSDAAPTAVAPAPAASRVAVGPRPTAPKAERVLAGATDTAMPEATLARQVTSPPKAAPATVAVAKPAPAPAPTPAPVIERAAPAPTPTPAAPAVTVPPRPAGLTRVEAAARPGRPVPLKNPSFEERGPGSEASGFGWLGGGDVHGINNASPHGGRSNAFNNGKWNSIYQSVNVQANTTYTLRAWARLTEGTEGDVQCIYVSGGGTDLREFVTGAEYKQYELTFRTGPSTTRIDIGAGEIKGSSVAACFDDFQLQKN